MPSKIFWIVIVVILLAYIAYANTSLLDFAKHGITGSAVSVKKLDITNKNSDISCKEDMDRWLDIHNERYGFSILEYKTVYSQDELKEYQNEIPSRQADVNADFLSYPTEAIVLKIIINKDERDLGICVCVKDKFVCEFGWNKG